MLQKRAPALAGTLRETVTFQRRAADAAGDRSGAWADEFAAPARVQTKTAGETVLAQRIAGVHLVDVTLRLDHASATIDTDWRLVWNGWEFQITSIAVDELARVVSILAARSGARE
jgi:hypothetical protein